MDDIQRFFEGLSLSYTTSKIDAARSKTWKSTGIVALRDANLKTLPSIVTELGPLARTLDASNNKIVELPSQIGQLVNLQRLILACNRLTSLPDSLCYLKALRVLDLNNNQLTSIPPISNNIAELPASLSHLKKLKALLVDDNKVAELPPTILVDCGALHTLSLYGNVINLDILEKMEGYDAFEGRRREKVDKQIAGNVMITSKNLDQGIQR